MKAFFITAVAAQEMLNPLSWSTEKLGRDICCVGSCQAPEEKYYSLDPHTGYCGECCMDPKYFNLYKIFEKWLAKDETTDSPCAQREYNHYLETEKHGVYPVTMTVDLYSKEDDGLDSVREMIADLQ